MDATLAQPKPSKQALPVTLGRQLQNVGRLLHTAIDGTVESFVNIGNNLAEKLAPKADAFAESLCGKVVIVTGGNAGIGFATAQQLARRGAHVVIACRDEVRAAEAVEALARSPLLPYATPRASGATSAVSSVPFSISAEPSGQKSVCVEAMPLDLGRLDSVRDFAAAWEARGLPLHMLVCNAGVMGPPRRLETANGLEMQFQVNFLSHWLLANQLLAIERDRRGVLGSGALASGAATRGSQGFTAASRPQNSGIPTTSGIRGAKPPACADGTRVVMVTSLTHRAGPLQWGDKQSELSYEPFLSYGLSKLANILAAKELQRRFDRSPQYGNDTAVAVHPGLVSTTLANGFFASRSTGWAEGTPLQPVAAAVQQGFGQLIGPLLMRSPEQSADVMLHACLAPRSQVAGRYLALGRPTAPDKAAEDPSFAAELWQYATQLTGYTPHVSLA